MNMYFVYNKNITQQLIFMSTKREVHRILSTKSATRKLSKGENKLIYENVMLYEMISE